MNAALALLLKMDTTGAPLFELDDAEATPVNPIPVIVGMPKFGRIQTPSFMDPEIPAEIQFP